MCRIKVKDSLNICVDSPAHCGNWSILWSYPAGRYAKKKQVICDDSDWWTCKQLDSASARHPPPTTALQKFETNYNSQTEARQPVILGTPYHTFFGKMFKRRKYTRDARMLSDYVWQHIPSLVSAMRCERLICHPPPITVPNRHDRIEAMCIKSIHKLIKLSPVRWRIGDPILHVRTPESRKHADNFDIIRRCRWDPIQCGIRLRWVCHPLQHEMTNSQ